MTSKSKTGGRNWGPVVSFILAIFEQNRCDNVSTVDIIKAQAEGWQNRWLMQKGSEYRRLRQKG
jgi:hypothetical protein